MRLRVSYKKKIWSNWRKELDPDPEMDPDPDPDPLVKGTEPRIRIHNKMSMSITVSKFARILQMRNFYIIIPTS